MNMIPPKKVGWMFLPWSKTMMSTSEEEFLQVQAFESKENGSTQEVFKRSQVPKFQSSSDQNVQFKSSGAQAVIAMSGWDRFAKVARLKYPQLKSPRDTEPELRAHPNKRSDTGHNPERTDAQTSATPPFVVPRKLPVCGPARPNTPTRVKTKAQKHTPRNTD